jgi:hypothetical protein
MMTIPISIISLPSELEPGSFMSAKLFVVPPKFFSESAFLESLLHLHLWTFTVVSIWQGGKGGNGAQFLEITK